MNSLIGIESGGSKGSGDTQPGVEKTIPIVVEISSSKTLCGCKKRKCKYKCKCSRAEDLYYSEGRHLDLRLRESSDSPSGQTRGCIACYSRYRFAEMPLSTSAKISCMRKIQFLILCLFSRRTAAHLLILYP